MITGVGVQALFQRTGCQPQSLSPSRRFNCLEIKIGDRSVA
jgi:hypothetical protein